MKPGSIEGLTWNTGLVERGNIITFQVAFESQVCHITEGQIMSCKVKNVTTAGIRAESAVDFPSPIVVFVNRDHHSDNDAFSEVKIDDRILVRVIGTRSELGDKWVSVVAELVVID